MARAADRDPRHHVEKMQKVLADVREDIDKVDEPRGHVRNLGRSARRLDKAFDDYGKNTEAAWRG